MFSKVEITETRITCIEKALTEGKYQGFELCQYILGCFCAEDLHKDTTWLNLEIERIVLTNTSTYTKISRIIAIYNVWADQIIKTF